MKRKKIYFIPGLISAIGLPLLWLYFTPRAKAAELQTVMKIFLPSDRHDDGMIIRFSKDRVYHSIRNKRILTIDLDDRDALYELDEIPAFIRKKKREFLCREIDRLQFTNDTNSVIKAKLGDSNTYGEFVWLLNLTSMYRIKRFAFLDNSFILFANPPSVQEPKEVY